MSVWDIVILLSKSLTYMAMLAIPGAFSVMFLYRRACHRAGSTQHVTAIRHLLTYYVSPALIVGVLAVSMFFLAQIGAVNQQGISGMLDREMGAIMATTALGDGVQWRMTGFLLAAFAAGAVYLGLKPHPYQQPLERAALVLAVLALLSFAWSFAILGHTSVLSLLAKLAITLHLMAVSLWIGALYPLYALCGVSKEYHASNDTGASQQGAEPDQGDDTDRSVLATLMHEFGQLGWMFIGVLAVTGIYLIVTLVGSWSAMLGSDYGQLLMIKLALVLGLLSLGAFNKFRLAPGLRDPSAYPQTVMRLQRTVTLEMALAVLVLLVTASFTTLTGPVS